MRRVLEGVGAAVLLAVAVACWLAGVTETTFAAVPDGAPEFVSTRYSGSWIAAATVCVIVALLLVVDVIRRRSHTR